MIDNKSNRKIHVDLRWSSKRTSNRDHWINLGSTITVDAKSIKTAPFKRSLPCRHPKTEGYLLASIRVAEAGSGDNLLPAIQCIDQFLIIVCGQCIKLL